MDTQPPADRENDVKSAYPEVFTGLDKLEGYKAHVHVDPDITLVAQPLHRDPGPLQHSQMPQAPWSRLHVDLCGPLPYHPQAKAEVEWFNATTMKAIRTK